MVGMGKGLSGAALGQLKSVSCMGRVSEQLGPGGAGGAFQPVPVTLGSPNHGKPWWCQR